MTASLGRVRRQAPILAPLLLAVLSVSAAAPSGSPYMRVDSVVVNATPAPRLPARAAVDWCGVGQPAVVDRKPETDLSSIRQVHITYVIPADAPDRFRSRVGPIATDVAAIDAWWRGQDASRTIRFDRYAFAGCTTTFGALDIGFLRLPRAGSAYVGEEGLDQLLWDLTRFESLPWHKHLVYYDGQNPFDESVCGTTLTNRFTRGAGGVEGVSFFWLGSLCAIDLGASGLAASVAVHELIHGLGALSEGSPHECAPPNRAHVCDSTADILTPFATGETRLATQVLDVNRDDYYDADAPPWYDVRGYSAWLSHLPQLPIQVNATGSFGHDPGQLPIRLRLRTQLHTPGGYRCDPHVHRHAWPRGTARRLERSLQRGGRLHRHGGPGDDRHGDLRPCVAPDGCRERQRACCERPVRDFLPGSLLGDVRARNEGAPARRAGRRLAIRGLDWWLSGHEAMHRHGRPQPLGTRHVRSSLIRSGGGVSEGVRSRRLTQALSRIGGRRQWVSLDDCRLPSGASARAVWKWNHCYALGSRDDGDIGVRRGQVVVGRNRVRKQEAVSH